MRAEFLLPEDPRWQRFLDAVPHDTYHLPGYLSFCAGQEGGEAVAFLAEDGDVSLLAPMLLRGLPESLNPKGLWRDASAPYGYACPLMAGGFSPAQLGGFLGAFRILGERQGIVSAFFRFHPLLPLPREPFKDYGTLVDHGETVYLDLALTLDELDANTRAGHKVDIVRLQREGYTVVVDAWDRLDDFVRIYQETMARHGASSFYFFPPDYYQALRAALGARLHLALVLAPGGATVACAGLFMEEDGTVEYHLSGTDAAFLKAAPSKLLIHQVRNWAKARGNRWFHLGGGVGAQADSLFDFKRGFSRLRSTFSSFRMIVDPEAYAELSSWGHGATDRKLLERRKYFPGYRRPSEREAS